MNNKLITALLFTIALSLHDAAMAEPLGCGFTYQGELRRMKTGHISLSRQRVSCLALLAMGSTDEARALFTRALKGREEVFVWQGSFGNPGPGVPAGRK